ncbi:hypothetical protein ElyMa_002880100 [Elysia marginata]|uniref:Uncharacterized protein n=1 Tax=Elysia marginata TaxID=1093978 RepID=A0AAV4I0W4_9GAST|nr:hypothetical protein ElyMa_002880100 [Elysia marginata]
MQQVENLHPKHQSQQHPVDIEGNFVLVAKDGMGIDHEYVDVQSEMQQQKDTHLKQQPQKHHPVDKEDDFVLANKDGMDIDYDYVDVLKEMQQDENLHPKHQSLQHPVDIEGNFVLVAKDANIEIRPALRFSPPYTIPTPLLTRRVAVSPTHGFRFDLCIG